MAPRRAAKGTLLVKVRLNGGDFGSADERDRLGAAELAIESALERETDAVLDGNEVGDGTWTLVIVGGELDRARSIVARSLTDAGVADGDVEFVRSPRPTRVLVGSVIAVPVDGVVAYIQYIGKDPLVEMGDMVIVFAETTTELRPLSEVRLERRLFGPVFAVIRWPVGQGEWTVVGRRPAPDEPFPGFRYRAPFRREVGPEWMIWDGFTHTRVTTLTDVQARLEERTGYLPAGLVGRISEELARQASVA